MSRALIVIASQADRTKAANWAIKAPFGTRIEFKQAKRTLPQNDRFWAMLTDVSRQLPWHGMKMTPGQWKLFFLDALRRELRLVPNIDGTGFVNIGTSSSDLTIGEMSDMMELITAFGAKHGVVFHDEAEAA